MRSPTGSRPGAWRATAPGSSRLTPRKPETGDGDGDGAAMRADLDLKMAAAGLRGVILDPGSGSGAGAGIGLTAKTDALVVQTASGRGRGADGGNLEPARATVTRLRLGLEASRPVRLGGEATLTPSLEVGVRHDGGDAETGFRPRPRRRARAERSEARPPGRAARARAAHPRVEGLPRARLFRLARLDPEAGLGPGREADADPDGRRVLLGRRRRGCSGAARWKGSPPTTTAAATWRAGGSSSGSATASPPSATVSR